MKRTICIVAILALCAPVLAQETLELRVVDEFDASVVDGSGGGTFNIEIQGRLNSDTSDGLALWGVNMTTSGSTYAGPVYDLCVELIDLAPDPGNDSDQFQKNKGLTNPDDGSGRTGFGGSCDGAGGLWQIGGGQNTIGNTGPTQYPFGPVVLDIANLTDWYVLAEGTVTIPALEVEDEDLVLTLDTGFANTIDKPATGPDVYDVSLANATIASALTFEGHAAGDPPYVVGDWYSWKPHLNIGPMSITFPATGTGDPGAGVETRLGSITELSLTFSEAMDTTTILASNIIVCGEANGDPGDPILTWAIGDTELTMTFTANQLGNGQTGTADRYKIALPATAESALGQLIDCSNGGCAIECLAQYGNVSNGGKTARVTNALDRNLISSNYQTPTTTASYDLIHAGGKSGG